LYVHWIRQFLQWHVAQSRPHPQPLTNRSCLKNMLQYLGPMKGSMHLTKCVCLWLPMFSLPIQTKAVWYL
jgi:hypothetical protein